MERIVDEVNIFVKAGDGGKGCESRTYLSEKKFIPTGGDGGRGGNVIVRADANLASLKGFLYHRHFAAKAGAPGGSNHKRGRNGQDLVISVPCGTMIFEKEKRYLIRDLVRPGEEVVLVEGGRGGIGNEGRKGAQAGQPGQNLPLTLRLTIPADVFLVGLPNAGKSKLLNHLAHTHAKEGSYPFTTKSPELGVFETPDFERFRLCELPGLYRESPEGHGLGFNFLKHLARAKMILLMLDPLSPFVSGLKEGYDVLLEVLARYDKGFLNIPRVVGVNKMDLPEARQRVEEEKFRPQDPFFLISAQSGEGIEALMRYLAQQIKGKSECVNG